MFCKTLKDSIDTRLDEILKLRKDYIKKDDDSYVSKGDLLVQDIIAEQVAREYPTHTFISEELAPFDESTFQTNNSYVIVDPIDGTENFVSGLKEWGIGLSVYTDGKHSLSFIYIPEIGDILYTGMQIDRFKSRIIGLSSSLSKSDLLELPDQGVEYRIVGCSMYNLLCAIRGAFLRYENVKGVNCWDILPGLNLAIEHGVKAEVDGEAYSGELLFPTKRYKIKIFN